MLVEPATAGADFPPKLLPCVRLRLPSRWWSCVAMLGFVPAFAAATPPVLGPDPAPLGCLGFEAVRDFLPDDPTVLTGIRLEAALATNLGSACGRADALRYGLRSLERSSSLGRHMLEEVLSASKDDLWWMAFRTTEPFDLEFHLRKTRPESHYEAERVGRYDIWSPTEPSPDGDPEASFVRIDDRRFMTAPAEVLKAILRRDGPARLDPAVAKALRELDHSRQLHLILKCDKKVRAELHGQLDLTLLPAATHEPVTVLVAQIRFRDEFVLDGWAECGRESAARELAQAINLQMMVGRNTGIFDERAARPLAGFAARTVESKTTFRLELSQQNLADILGEDFGSIDPEP